MNTYLKLKFLRLEISQLAHFSFSVEKNEMKNVSYELENHFYAKTNFTFAPKPLHLLKIVI